MALNTTTFSGDLGATFSIGSLDVSFVKSSFHVLSSHCIVIMKFTDAVYEAADSDDSSTILGDDQHDLELLELKTRSLTRTSLANFLNSPWTFLVHAVIFSLSLTLFITAHLNPPISTQRYLEQYTSWSPARAVVRYEPYTFNSTKGKLSGYMGHGWQVDQKWNRITTDLGDQMISETELEQLGKSNTSTRVMDHATGVEGYRVMLQVFHQLRCLNKLRKAVHWDDYEGDGDLSGDREETRNELGE
ncbi:hypothetical protein UCRPC4_g00275 [Phaeomoniella chlamydospora]|uniref:Uncharacterized protein n=1 Tax=Phaeomoniella chlamydospora TaxID=158046 RepID=A0A0G2F496_PHACM|nr:hypothetical protein UCRPC4_g00275 [Phaeomoniella chlamydospora]